MMRKAFRETTIKWIERKRLNECSAPVELYNTATDLQKLVLLTEGLGFRTPIDDVYFFNLDELLEEGTYHSLATPFQDWFYLFSTKSQEDIFLNKNGAIYYERDLQRKKSNGFCEFVDGLSMLESWCANIANVSEKRSIRTWRDIQIIIDALTWDEEFVDYKYRMVLNKKYCLVIMHFTPHCEEDAKGALVILADGNIALQEILRL